MGFWDESIVGITTDYWKVLTETTQESYKNKTKLIIIVKASSLTHSPENSSEESYKSACAGQLHPPYTRWHSVHAHVTLSLEAWSTKPPITKSHYGITTNNLHCLQYLLTKKC